MKIAEKRVHALTLPSSRLRVCHTQVHHLQHHGFSEPRDPQTRPRYAPFPPYFGHLREASMDIGTAGTRDTITKNRAQGLEALVMATLFVVERRTDRNGDICAWPGSNVS